MGRAFRFVFFILAPLLTIWISGLFLLSNHAYAQNDLNIGIVHEPYQNLSVMIENFAYPSEITPIVLPNPDGKRLYILPGGNSSICLSDGNLLNQDVFLPQSDCRINATRNVIVYSNEKGETLWQNPDDVADEMLQFPWRFSYDGVFAASINQVTNKLLLIRYFEHQNYVYRWRSGFRECGNNPANYYLYRSNIHVNISSDYCTCEEQSYVCQGWSDSNPLCVDGNNICPADLSGPEHGHSWPSWAIGGTLGWADFSPTQGYQLSEVHDEGPIIWSQQAYRVNGKNNYKDVSPHETVIKDGYIYLFYSMKPREGQNSGAGCFGLARSKLEDDGMPGTWQNYYQEAFGPNTLPTGYDKSRISEFYEVVGGAADCVLPLAEEYQDQGVTTWINIAKFKDLPYYISVEETSPHWQTYQMGIRFSSDLINWTPLQIIETKDTKWGDGNYTYPRFLNKEGMSNKEIDLNEFYLYGKKIGPFIIQSLKMSLILKPPVEKIDQMINQYYYQMIDQYPADLSNYQNIMQQSGCKGVIKNISLSDEFMNGKQSSLTDEEYIKLLFRAILSYNPSEDDSGYQWYLGNLEAGSFTRDTIIDNMTDIVEARDACITGKELVSVNNIFGDINKDGVVDIQDYILLSNAFGTNDQNADLNNDGVVDIQDYVILSNNFGKTI